MRWNRGRLRRRPTAIGVIAVAAVLGLAACGSGGGTSGGGGGSVTLTVSELTPFKAGEEILIKNFEQKYPNIHINATYADNAGQAQAVLAGLQAGNAPDVFFALPAAGSPTSVWNLGKAGKLLDLSDQAYVANIPAALKDGVSYQGKVYATPQVESLVGILYNTATWNQLGLTEPQTFADVLTLCGKVKAAGKTLFTANLDGNGALGISSGLPISQILMDEFVYSIDPTWTDKRNSGTEKFATSDLWRQGYGVLPQMKAAGCFEPSPEGTTTSQSSALIATGKAVAMMTSGAATPTLKALKSDLDFKLIPFPSFQASNTVAAANSSTMVVNAATAHPAEAKQFINFISQADQNTAFASANGTVSPFGAAKGQLPAYMSEFEPYYANDKVVSDKFDTFANPSLFVTVLTGYIPGIMSGQTLVDKLLTDADYLWDNPTATAAK